VNAAMLRMARTAFPQAHILFAGDATHIHHVNEMDPGTGREIEWLPLEIPLRHGLSSGSRRRAEWRLWGQLLELIDQRGVDRLILLGMSMDGLLDIKAWLWRRPRVRVLVVLHAVLGVAMGSRRSRLQWWLAPAPRLRWLVLGQHIAEALGSDFAAITPRVRWIPHPVLALDGPGGGHADPALPGPSTVFAFPGLATSGKGFDQFCHLARSLAGDPRARFELVGRLPPDEPAHSPDNVLLPDLTDGRLAREEYERRIRNAHYLVLPMRPTAYRYVASGSIVDALALGRPLMGLAASPPTRDLFAQFGDVGYLCDDMNAMVDVARRLTHDPDPERYRSQLANLASARAALAPDALAPCLRDHLG
jgi:pimeloyl-ACP methyl ester carboxylesterase